MAHHPIEATLTTTDLSAFPFCPQSNFSSEYQVESPKL